MAENPDQKIYQQIEKTADTYEPAVYELLTFYSALENQADELDGQFIPTSTVKPQNAQQVKIFAVGVLPPSSNVTGRLLDRSASVNAIEPGQAPQDLNADTGGAGGVGTSYTPPIGATSSKDPGFWSQYVAMCNRLGVTPEALTMVLNSESGMNPAAQALRDSKGRPCTTPSDDCFVVAKGLNQLTHSTATGLGMSEDEWQTYQNQNATDQLKWVEKSFAGRIKGKNAAQIYAANFGGYNNPNGSLYDGSACSKGYTNCKYQEIAYKSNLGLDKDKKGFITPDDMGANLSKVSPSQQAAIDKAKQGLGMQTDVGSTGVGNNGNTTPGWNSTGSNNASDANKTLSQSSSNDLNKTDLGQQFLAAQFAMIKATQAALDQMARTPPLRLLVNPRSFKVGSEKIISDGNWGRNGPIVEHWGEQQDTIEGSGKIAGFYSIDAVGGSNSSGAAGAGPGLTRTARQFSLSYQNLLSLWLLYKNNGGIWLPDLTDNNSSKRTNLNVVGSIYIYYDDILYIGSFDSFNINEAEEAPFALEYDFTFKVRAWFLLDRTDDTFTYGAPQFFQGSAQPPPATTNPGTNPIGPTTGEQPAPDVPLPNGLTSDQAATLLFGKNI